MHKDSHFIKVTHFKIVIVQHVRKYSSKVYQVQREIELSQLLE